MQVVRTPVFEVSLFELLKAYGDQRRRATSHNLVIEATELYALSEAIERLRGIIGTVESWTTLATFLPEELRGGLVMRSAVASTFAASLELVKDGRADLRQSTPFGPIYIKGKKAAANG